MSRIKINIKSFHDFMKRGVAAIFKYAKVKNIFHMRFSALQYPELFGFSLPKSFRYHQSLTNLEQMH